MRQRGSLERLRQNWRGAGVRAFMLLEIVVSVALLVLGMAVIGAQLQSAADTTYATDHLARLVFLAETRMAELDSGLVIPNEQIGKDTTDVEIEQDFGRLYPQYAARVTLSPTATADLLAVRLDMFYDPTRMIREHGASLPDFEYDDDKIEQTYYTLRAVPKPLNLKTDFGLDDDIAQRINDQVANSATGLDGVDVENFSPALFKDLTPEQLVELLSILQQAFGADQSALLQLVPESMRGQLQALMRGLDTGGTGDEGTGDQTGGGDTGGGTGGAGDGGNRGGGRDTGRRGSRGGSRGAGTGDSTAPSGGDTGGTGARGGSSRGSGGQRGSSRSGGANRGGGN